MGNQESVISHGEMNDYKKLTYLTEEEIHKCFNKFSILVDNNKLTAKQVKSTTIGWDQFSKSPDFQGNPFGARIFTVFSTDKEMTFEDFLNMYSVFSEAAPPQIKSRYAFQIYDFSNKNYLRKEDVKTLIKRLVGTKNAEAIPDKDMDLLIKKIFEEADIDQNGRITYEEFEHIVIKSPEFPKSFCVRI